MKLPKYLSFLSLLILALGVVAWQLPTMAWGATYGASQATGTGELNDAPINTNNDSGDNNDDQSDDHAGNDDHASDDGQDHNNDNGNTAPQGELTDVFHPIDEPVPPPDDSDEEKNEEHVQKIHDDLQDKIDHGDVKDVTIDSVDDNDVDKMGDVEIEDHQGDKEVAEAPASQEASIIEIKTQNGREIKIRFDKQGQVTIEDNGVLIQTSLDINYNVDTGAVTVSDPTTINNQQLLTYFPGDLLASISDRNKPSNINELKLEVRPDGSLAYRIEGPQDRKFLGVIPTSGNVTTVVDANTGNIIDLQKPWYFDVFGLLFSLNS